MLYSVLYLTAPYCHSHASISKFKSGPGLATRIWWLGLKKRGTSETSINRTRRALQLANCGFVDSPEAESCTSLAYFSKGWSGNCFAIQFWELRLRPQWKGWLRQAVLPKLPCNSCSLLGWRPSPTNFMCSCKVSKVGFVPGGSRCFFSCMAILSCGMMFGFNTCFSDFSTSGIMFLEQGFLALKNFRKQKEHVSSRFIARHGMV